MDKITELTKPKRYLLGWIVITVIEDVTGDNHFIDDKVIYIDKNNTAAGHRREYIIYTEEKARERALKLSKENPKYKYCYMEYLYSTPDPENAKGLQEVPEGYKKRTIYVN